jgi:hypothetical protein
MMAMALIAGQDINPALKNPISYEISVIAHQKECLRFQRHNKYLNDPFLRIVGYIFPGFHFYLTKERGSYIAIN